MPKKDGLTPDQINDALLQENREDIRRSARVERARIFESSLSANVNESEISVDNTYLGAESTASPAEISDSSDDESETEKLDPTKPLRSIEEMLKVLQAEDSETEEDFPENDFDPKWYPANDADENENEIIEDDAVQNNAHQTDLSTNAVLANGASQQFNASSKNKKATASNKKKVNTSTRNKANKLKKSKKADPAEPKWEKVPTENITNPKKLIKLDNIKNYSKEFKVIGIENLSPYQVFLKLFPEEVFELVATETNRYAKVMINKNQPLKPHSRLHKWKDVTPAKIKAFIAVELVMGIVKKPTLQSYWDDVFFLTETPGYAQVMSKDEYLLIRSALHFADNDAADTTDKLYKLRPLMDKVQHLYTEIYCPHKELSVDETIIKFKGALQFLQYLPDKPTKWGIKLWSLCDARTGYLLKFMVYLGAEPNAPKVPGGLGSRVVLDILHDFKYLGHEVYMDNYYSSIPLYRSLKKLDIGATGTINIRRKYLPTELKTIKLKQGDLPAYWVENKEILACTWQDIGRVNMLSNIGDTGITNKQVKKRKAAVAPARKKRKLANSNVDSDAAVAETDTARYIDKPNCNIAYNKYMGGVDVFDSLSKTYHFLRKTYKWYQVIWQFLIQTAIVNARIAYIIQNPNQAKKMTAGVFRKEIINGLLEGFARTPPERRRGRKRKLEGPLDSRLKERHFPSKEETKKKPDCAVCSIRPNKCKGRKGKRNCKRHQTTFKCNECDGKPALCVVNPDGLKCFEIYQTKYKFKMECKCPRPE